MKRKTAFLNFAKLDIIDSQFPFQVLHRVVIVRAILARSSINDQGVEVGLVHGLSFCTFNISKILKSPGYSWIFSRASELHEKYEKLHVSKCHAFPGKIVSQHRPSVASGRDLVSLAEQLSTGMWCHAVEVLGMRTTNVEG